MYVNFDDLPDNIQDSYKVYVKDIESSIDDIDDVSVAGYRNEDTWYDADGVEVSNPEVIAELSKTGTITPFLIDPNDNIQESTYDHGSAFKDYVPYLSVMPRILFNFELKENAMFFAHYDVLTQRPSSGYLATPFDYMFMRELNNIQTFSNPDLTPQQTIDYSYFEWACICLMTANVYAILHVFIFVPLNLHKLETALEMHVHMAQYVSKYERSSILCATKDEAKKHLTNINIVLQNLKHMKRYPKTVYGPVDTYTIFDAVKASLNMKTDM